MKNLAVARRYAKALLIIGKGDGNAEKYREELDGVTQLFTGNEMLDQVVGNPLYSASARKKSDGKRD